MRPTIPYMKHLNSTFFFHIKYTGQWYARACNLPPVLAPKMALSCYRTIYKMNVVTFGDGKLLGAVNGMRPDGTIDNSCIQSREVWTGTTYALAAGMLQESNFNPPVPGPETNLNPQENINIENCENYINKNNDMDLNESERKELVNMAFNTAQGIHDAGWQEFGYWFATPEAYERNGNYRSLGYMRPLSIWAMQYALSCHKK